MAYFGSKGYFVSELKKLGIRSIEGRKLESFKAHVLSAALEKAQGK